MSWPARWAALHLRGLFQQSELRVLGLALLCAVAATSAVQMFSDRVGRALQHQSSETLGADIILSSRRPLTDELRAAWSTPPLDAVESIQLPSVVWFGDKSELAGIKTAEPGYPLRGTLRTAAALAEADTPTDGIPPPGEAWADMQLWNALRLEPNSLIEVGAAKLRVSRLLSYEPDRGSGFVDMAPRLLINAADLPATQLLGPGSRAQYRALVAGPEEALARLLDVAEQAPDVSAITPRDARPEINAAMQRADSFLALAALTAALLGAVAVALCAHQYAARLQSDVALLRCLGATRATILRALLGTLLAIGLLAGGLGAVIGLLAQYALNAIADILVLGQLPAPRIGALLQAWLIALILLAGFALPPLMSAASSPPVAVFQARMNKGRAMPWRLAAVVGLISLMAVQTRSVEVLIYVGVGQAATAGVLALLGWLLLKLLGGLRHGRLRGWQLGLGNLVRRSGLSLAQSVSLGLGLLALLLLTVVRQDLLEGWLNRLPPDTPNQFLLNIQGDQLDELRELLARYDISAERIWPMARARLIEINAQSVDADSFDDPETQRWINRDFNLSWTDELGADNRITEGQWWGEAGQGQAWLSADTYAQERLNLRIGDTLTLDFAGRPITLEVHHFREVNWDSFQPNFFLITPPGVLNEMPASWLTSFYLPGDNRDVIRALHQELPNIMALDLARMIEQVQDIMRRIVGALQTVFLFTIVAGLIVLLAALETGRDARSREIAIMRTLGASRREVQRSLLTEFAGLGLLSGLVAAIAAQAAGWALATWVFEFDYRWNLTALLGSALASAGLICAVAWVSLRGVLNTPPDQVLRSV